MDALDRNEILNLINSKFLSHYGGNASRIYSVDEETTEMTANPRFFNDEPFYIRISICEDGSINILIPVIVNGKELTPNIYEEFNDLNKVCNFGKYYTDDKDNSVYYTYSSYLFHKLDNETLAVHIIKMIRTAVSEFSSAFDEQFIN